MRGILPGGLTLLLLAFFAPAAQGDKIVLEYWDKWTGIEAEAMQHIVDDYNASQDRVEVRYSAISQIDLKLMLAIAGRHPPDIAGIWPMNIPTYAENNALLPLDGLAARAGIHETDYLPSIWSLCCYRGRLWSLPTTPASTALYWNKRLFREAGLDPEKPPRTIAELEQFNEKLTRRNADGTYLAFGHLPPEPGWWSTLWGYWFGARLWDGDGHITITDPGNLRMLQWYASYPQRFGVREVSTFLQGSGVFASPLNPFIQEKVAMEMQGPWLWNFIQKYSTKPLDLGVAAFPSESGLGPPVTFVDADVLSIPVDCPHVHEAFAFIEFVNRRQELEKLCIAQYKFSPLRQVSADFWEKNPNPFIKIFYDLAGSPAAIPYPPMTIWPEYKNEIGQGLDDVWAQRATPQEVVQRVQARIQPKLDRENQHWARLSGPLQKIWDREENQP